MKIKFINKKIDYDGSQLTSHWIYKNFNILGDCVVAFVGKCNIIFENMVDLEDLKRKEKIFSKNMLHFIGEFFKSDLEKILLIQRIFAEIVKDEIEKKIDKKILRIGNDLYEKKKKLNISVATLTPISSLFHFGINISSEDTPVETAGLSDYKIEVVSFAKTILKRFKKELEDIKNSVYKVRWVK
jgi:hypothetical protein